MQFKLDLVVLCAYSVVTPHQLPGVPELSKLQSAGAEGAFGCPMIDLSIYTTRVGISSVGDKREDVLTV
jgi:hypothetical protein